jgi:hypothetical protein
MISSLLETGLSLSTEISCTVYKIRVHLLQAVGNDIIMMTEQVGNWLSQSFRESLQHDKLWPVNCSLSTPWSRVTLRSSWTLLVKSVPTFCGTRMLITKARPHLELPYFYNFYFNIILSLTSRSHKSYILSTYFLQQKLYTFLTFYLPHLLLLTLSSLFL